MALAVDKARVDNVSRFERLTNEAGRITVGTQKWMDETAAFYAQLTDPAEKAEVKALRDKLIADLKAILG